MRVTILRDMGRTWKAGDVTEVPDDVARQLIDAGLMGELPDLAAGGVQSSDILVPESGGEAAFDSPARL